MYKKMGSKIFFLICSINIFCVLGIDKVQMVVNAQTRIDIGNINYYPFMDKLPKDYKYYKNDYIESQSIIYDSSIIWSQKEYYYWRYFVSNIALLVSDSTVKGVWKEAYVNSPHAMCDFYSWIFNQPFDSKSFHQSPVAYYYLHNEKQYFDCICNNLFNKYDSTLIRKLWVIITDDHGRSKREISAIQNSKDSLNQIKVASVIRELGKYPGRSVVGTSQEEIAWLVIQHAPAEYQELYFPYIEKAVNQHDLNPKYLAYSIDRLNMAKGISQVYGTQYTVIDGVNRLYPVKDFTNIDKLRKSLGLEPIKKYMDHNKIVYK